MAELSIKVTIAGRTYPLTVKHEEEEKVRKAAKLIDKNISDLEDNYAVRDKQDLLAMAALEYANQVMEGKIHTTDDDEVVQQLDELEAKVDSYLEQVKG
ncbi:MAG: cell division protein ZapA [Flavobacteriales bacterium]|nr:MAG: cell division protein ZapA [Flavobacteriales bacterium]